MSYVREFLRLQVILWCVTRLWMIPVAIAICADSIWFGDRFGTGLALGAVLLVQLFVMALLGTWLAWRLTQWALRAQAEGGVRR